MFTTISCQFKSILFPQNQYVSIEIPSVRQFICSPFVQFMLVYVSIFISSFVYVIFKPFPLARSKPVVLAVENSGLF